MREVQEGTDDSPAIEENPAIKRKSSILWQGSFFVFSVNDEMAVTICLFIS